VSELRIEPSDSGDQERGAAQTVSEYVDANFDRYTADALVAVALAAGYPEADVRSAIEAARARRQATEPGIPARRIVIGAYLITYLALLVGLYWPGASAAPFGALAAIILSVVLGLAFLISLGWLAMALPSSLVGLLSVPLVLLVLVGGSCIATSGSLFGFRL
jgi:hypothetical protein